MHGPHEGDDQRVSRPDPPRSHAPRGERVAGRLLVVVGPTGTGKSDLAVRLAEQLDGEIVGCDSLQVYRRFDAATAKPSPEARRRVPHHLIDVVDPGVDYSVAEYVRDADRAIHGILERGHVPIVVGGTGLYLRGLLRGVVPAPERDEQLRRRLRRIVERRGAPRAHRWLTRLDPGSAARVHPGDSQRTVRALELALTDGGTWSERLRRDGTWSSGAERYDSLKVLLELDRVALAERLTARVGAFFDAGLVEEVRRLLGQGVPETANAFKGIGYREVVRALRAGSDGDSVRDEVARNTLRYAKRQRTWFRSEPALIRIDAAAGVESIAARIAARWGVPGPDA